MEAGWLVRQRTCSPEQAVKLLDSCLGFNNRSYYVLKVDKTMCNQLSLMVGDVWWMQPLANRCKSSDWAVVPGDGCFAISP